ncbi:hypothetical protein JB92DRAFT_3095183, partial [Gautieria morchelliformis]
MFLLSVLPLFLSVMAASGSASLHAQVPPLYATFFLMHLVALIASQLSLCLCPGSPPFLSVMAASASLHARFLSVPPPCLSAIAACGSASIHAYVAPLIAAHLSWVSLLALMCFFLIISNNILFF